MPTLDALSRAYNHVRSELRSLGLLDDGHGLDAIECDLALLPAGWWGTAGFVYDRGVGGIAALAGFREGVIYVPWNAKLSRERGYTLRDLVRHEYAHAWAWLEPDVVEGAWFRKTFGAAYDAPWDERPAFDPEGFVSEYATTSAAEDFAETFCVVLRERERALTRWPSGVRRKIEAVRLVVERAARRVARGPRSVRRPSPR